MKNWLLDSILGESAKPSPAVPEIPIIDTREVIWSSGKRTRGLQRALDKCARDEAVKIIFGADFAEMADLVKNPVRDMPASGVRPPFEPVSPATPAREPIPQPILVTDPRKIDCKCPCQMCRSGSGCWNCLGDEDGVKCEFHSLRILDELVPVDPEAKQSEMEQAATRQRARIADARVVRHRKGLAPAFSKFRNDIPYGYRPRVIAALNKVHEAAASYVAYAVAAGG